MGEYTDYINELRLEYYKYCETTEYNEPLVSIIVPAYNVEKYIERCLFSLVKQSLKNIEIIVIDDGSEDMTPDIINVFGSMDSRIKVIHQNNQGLSAARNKGIDLSRGEYIAFVDSDDCVDDDFIEKLYIAITQNNSDIAASTIVRKRKYSQKYRVHYKEEKIYSTLKEKLDICRIPVCCYVWNKLYKASLVKTHKFAEGVYYEDVLWTPAILKDSDKLVTVPNTNYYYWVNKGSVVKKAQSPQKQKNAYNAKKYIINFYKENGIELSEKAKNITKSIKYLFGIPILKTKEYNGIDTTILFGFLPICKQPVNKTFLIFNTACFGDNLVCNALCQNIKRIYPESKIVFIVNKPFADVARHQKDVDEIIIYDKKGEHKGLKGLFKFIKSFKYKNAYAAIITYRNVRNYWIALLSHTKHIVKGRKLSLSTISAQEQILNLLKAITKEQLINVPIKYELNGTLSDDLETILPNDKKYIAMCCLTKNPPKDMPSQTAIDVIKRLSEKYKIILTGVGNDSLKYAELLESAGCDFINLVNKTSINELALVLQKCEFLISVDTGTMHLGYAIGVPTVAVFYEDITLKCWAPNKNIYPHTNVLFKPSSEDIIKEVLKNCD